MYWEWIINLWFCHINCLSIRNCVQHEENEPEVAQFPFLEPQRQKMLESVLVRTLSTLFLLAFL
ncbi:unnamed protein product [Meloidogyne enterolobii]|uniref:Uncharacterized protein n=1 Tax=Meloidogyne enterolobii TaxID=390850 RepID=A0ACB0ZWP7_MELEN